MEKQIVNEKVIDGVTYEFIRNSSELCHGCAAEKCIGVKGTLCGELGIHCLINKGIWKVK